MAAIIIVLIVAVFIFSLATPSKENKMTLKALNKIINDDTRHPQTRMSALFKKQELIIKRCGQMKRKQKTP